MNNYGIQGWSHHLKQQIIVEYYVLWCEVTEGDISSLVSDVKLMIALVTFLQEINFTCTFYQIHVCSIREFSMSYRYKA
jgi:hypothetical protein